MGIPGVFLAACTAALRLQACCVPSLVGLLLVICCEVYGAQLTAQDSVGLPPVLRDDRLEIKQFAGSEQIVTPIGMAIDEADRVFVIESHTHLPPSDYDGPKSDRIKVFVDADNDGAADTVEVFADGLTAAMNLAFSPTGDLYVVCAREVVGYRNVDGKLDAASRWQVLKLETEERYAHNCLLGITFDREGHLFVARGNTGGRAYRLVGTDGSSVHGYGDGGSVVVCDPAGKNLREYATGFWNPFDLKFDARGELLLVDNDPDARGPNRLVHVVDEGDYGYKSLYGGGGNHPFQGWDGSLAGTLPYISGVGEAPSGLIDARQTSFPTEYQDSVLVTIWNENTIERIYVANDNGRLISHGKTTLLTGGKNFRPVALAADSRGNLFVTDWVLVDYPNHGQGKIWRISPRDQPPVDGRMKPRSYFDTPIHSQPRLEASLRERIVDRCPFVRHQAVLALARNENVELRQSLRRSQDRMARLGSLLADKRASPGDVGLITTYLSDVDAEVRTAALVWAGETHYPSLRPVVQQSISVSPVTAKLFSTWVAALENLQPKYASEVRSQAAGKSKDLHPEPEDDALFAVVVDASLSSEVRSFAVDALSDGWAKTRARELLSFVESRDALVAARALERLSNLTKSAGLVVDEELRNQMQRIAKERVADPQAADSLRIACARLLVSSPTPPWRSLVQLVHKKSPGLAYFVARSLRDAAAQADDLSSLASSLQEQLVASGGWESLSAATREQIRIAAEEGLAVTASTQPTSKAEWIALASELGSADRGKFVFQSQRLGCARCHSIDGRGALLGPDLGQVAASKTVAQIAEAIVDPSRDFPPQYQAWLVADVDGRVHRGIQMDHKSRGAIEMLSEQGELIRLSGDEVDFYKASSSSLMPDGLAAQLTSIEFRDLLAYLAAMK